MLKSKPFTLDDIADKLHKHRDFSLRIFELVEELQDEAETCYYAKADDLYKIIDRIKTIAKETILHDQSNETD